MIIIRFWLTAGFLVVLSLLNPCRGQQGSIFNQSPFQRQQQSLFRQQQQQQQQQPVFSSAAFSPVTSLNSITPLSAIAPQSAYRPYNPQNYVPITAYQNELNYDGSFAYGYSSADGTTAQAQGYVKNLGLGEAAEAQVVQGSYSYTSPEGTPITVRYVADENGFRAEGAHIPTPPPIPDAIAKSLQYISSVQQQKQQKQQQQPFQQSGLNANPNLNPYQTPFRQFGAPAALRLGQQQLTPLQLQQQRYYQQQNSGQYQPDNPFNQQPTALGLSGSTSGLSAGSSLQQQQQQQQDQNLQQQQQQQQQNLTTQRQQSLLTQQQTAQQQQQQQSTQQQAAQQQPATQQLQGRPSQLVNPFALNQYRRYKKETKA